MQKKWHCMYVTLANAFARNGVVGVQEIHGGEGGFSGRIKNAISVQRWSLVGKNDLLYFYLYNCCSVRKTYTPRAKS